MDHISTSDSDNSILAELPEPDPLLSLKTDEIDGPSDFTTNMEDWIRGAKRIPDHDAQLEAAYAHDRTLDNGHFSQSELEDIQEHATELPQESCSQSEADTWGHGKLPDHQEVDSDDVRQDPAIVDHDQQFKVEALRNELRLQREEADRALREERLASKSREQEIRDSHRRFIEQQVSLHANDLEQAAKRESEIRAQLSDAIKSKSDVENQVHTLRELLDGRQREAEQERNEAAARHRKEILQRDDRHLEKVAELEAHLKRNMETLQKEHALWMRQNSCKVDRPAKELLPAVSEVGLGRASRSGNELFDGSHEQSCALPISSTSGPEPGIVDLHADHKAKAGEIQHTNPDLQEGNTRHQHAHLQLEQDLKRENDILVRRLQREHQDEIVLLENSLRKQCDADMRVLKTDHRDALQTVERKHDTEIASLKDRENNEHQSAIRNLLAKHQKAIAALETEHADAVADLEAKAIHERTIAIAILEKRSKAELTAVQEAHAAGLRALTARLQSLEDGLRAQIATLEAQLRTAKAAETQSVQSMERLRQENKETNRTIDAQMLAKLRKREDQWRKRYQDLEARSKTMSKALMEAWGKDELGPGLPQAYRYRYVEK